ESVRPASVEAQHPVPDDLKPVAADLGRLGARRTVIDRRKRQKPPGLRTVVGSPGQTAQLRRIKIPAKGDRSGTDKPPWFATLDLTRPHRAIGKESRFQRLGISQDGRANDENEAQAIPSSSGNDAGKARKEGGGNAAQLPAVGVRLGAYPRRETSETRQSI